MFLFSLLLSGIGFSKPIDSLSALQEAAEEISADYNLLQANLTDRKGVLGAKRASQLYDRALRAYMLSNYEEATVLFFTLIQDGSLLYDNDQHYKAQWFLIESAEALGSTKILEEECLRIANEDQHPFYTDAIRKLLELYGRIGDIESFRKIVREHVDTGKVQRTDKIRYTLGKSLHWQGDSKASIDMLSSIKAGSLFFEKAQYFIGGIHAGAGEFTDAITYFSAIEKRLEKKVINDKLKIDFESAGTATSDEQTIYELSLLAQGRVFLERAEYVQKDLLQTQEK